MDNIHIFDTFAHVKKVISHNLKYMTQVFTNKFKCSASIITNIGIHMSL